VGSTPIRNAEKHQEYKGFTTQQAIRKAQQPVAWASKESA
jgi:hypothetical protein